MRVDTVTIRAEVMMEINNPAYEHLRHGHRSTYGAGCRGPLCKWKNRVDMRTHLNKSRPPEKQITGTDTDEYLATLQRAYEIEYSSAREFLAS